MTPELKKRWKDLVLSEPIEIKYWQQRGSINAVGKGYATFAEANKHKNYKLTLTEGCACHRPRGYEGQINGMKKSIANLQMARMHIRIDSKPSVWKILAFWLRNPSRALEILRKQMATERKKNGQ